MDPIKNFNHFIAYFIPGIILLLVVLMLVSLGAHQDLLAKDFTFKYVFLVAVGSVILGLFVDDARHNTIENWLEKAWASRNGYDLNEIIEYSAYIPILGKDTYNAIMDEVFYFYEFDYNVGVALLCAAVVLPLYLHRFYHVTSHLYVIGLVFGAVAFFYFGKKSFDYFLDSLISAIDIAQPGFSSTIKLPK
jgi:hypothetical protein